jgi:Glycerophosphoryl diester phosphodiesterase
LEGGGPAGRTHVWPLTIFQGHRRRVIPVPDRPIRIAHRGAPRRAPENTLPSFELALDIGAEGLELDVHATRDGVVVIHHDPALRQGLVIADTDFAELRRHEMGPGVPIPTLTELCAMVAGRAELFVEIKGADIEVLVLEALAGYTGPVAIHSFDHTMIRRLHVRRAPYPLGLLFEEGTGAVAAAMDDFGASDIWPHFTLVDEELVATVHARGGRIIPWTVNQRTDATILAAMGVDGLCGDDVSIFMPADPVHD